MEMGLTHWQRVLVGFSGGILIMGGIWLFATINNVTRMLAFLPILAGIIAIFYGRYGK